MSTKLPKTQTYPVKIYESSKLSPHFGLIFPQNNINLTNDEVFSFIGSCFQDTINDSTKHNLCHTFFIIDPNSFPLLGLLFLHITVWLQAGQ